MLATAALYAREDGDSITVSTISPETVTTSTTTYETTLTGEDASTTEITVGTTTTDVTISRPTEVINIAETTTTTITYSFSTTEAGGSTFTLTSTETETTIPVSTTVFEVTSYETRISIDSYETGVEVDGSTVTVTVPGTETDVIVPSEQVTVTILDTTTSDAVFTSVTATSGGESTSFDITVTLTIPQTTTTYTPTETVVTITIPSTSTIVTLSKVSTVTSETTITIPESVMTYTIGGTTEESSTTEESTTSEDTTNNEESSTTTEESSSVTEESTATEESSTTEESTASEESFTTFELSSTTSGTAASSPIAPAPTPTANPTYCEVVRGPLTPEEEVQLQVLFSDRAGASAFADYVVSYASQLVAQIAGVANIAVGDNNYAFTTAFNTIDIPGILGLASAAPIYTCFLSSLWAQALSDPQQYAKRAVPTQDEKIKLIVLFEKRENSGMDFDYAELLVDETNDLIAEVQNVSAAAANGDLGAYASLFANVDVPYFLSIATEAPIYTEGLSAALQTALASYSESAFRPTVTTMTTRTYTTVNTIVTNFVNGTVTVPTTIVSTKTVVTVEPVGQVQAASTALQAAPAPTANAPVNKVTTEVVTLGNGRVETRTVTICVENCDTVVAESTRRPAAVQTVTTRPNVAVYTQVQNGVTYTHTIEIQTKNAALKKVAALGAGILGGAALLL